jgi:hypothetical protein
VTPNLGSLPPEAIGKRVRVQLANGRVCGTEPVNSDSPIGWRADTTRWSLTGRPHDVAAYEVIR